MDQFKICTLQMEQMTYGLEATIHLVILKISQPLLLVSLILMNLIKYPIEESYLRGIDF